MPVSRRALLCDWVWQAAGGRPHRFPHNNVSSVYWIFTKLGHMIPLWKGKNPIYFGVITIIPFDNLYRRAYFVMHTFLVLLAIVLCVLLWFTDSDYHFGIFKLFFHTIIWKDLLSLYFHSTVNWWLLSITTMIDLLFYL
jgi:hypothetical protein